MDQQRWRYPDVAGGLPALEAAVTDPVVAAWIDDQRSLADRWLHERSAMRWFAERLELLDLERRGTPAPRHGYRYFWRQLGQGQFLVEQHPDGHDRVVARADAAEAVDPVIGSWSVSPCRGYLAYQACDLAAEVGDVRLVRLGPPDVDRALLPTLRRPVFAWQFDASTGRAMGLYYCRSGAGDLVDSEAIPGLYHRDLAGGPARLVWAAPSHAQDAPAFVTPMMAPGGRRLALMLRYGADALTGLWLARIDGDGPELTEILEVLPAGESRCVARFHTDETLIVLSDHDGPGGVIYRAEAAAPQVGRWKELFVPPAGEVVRDFAVSSGHVAVCVSAQASTDVVLVPHDGGGNSFVALPGRGSAGRLTSDLAEQRFWVMYSDLLRPQSVLQFRPGEPASVWFSPGDLGLEGGPKAITMSIESADDVTIPITLYRCEGSPDGPLPLVLEVYGGFGRSVRTRFRAEVLQWTLSGGIWAVAHVRGGAERGAISRESGRGRGKAEAVADCARVAEYLVSQRITGFDRLAISGTSNGGLLAAACAILRPELFAACVVNNPVADLEKFPLWGDGRSWIDEYGNPSDPEELAVLLGYSPVRQAQSPKHFPAFLITVGLDDKRVAPAHGMKLCAALQRFTTADSDAAPILFMANPGGHVVQSPSLQRASVGAKLGFMAAVLGLDPASAPAATVPRVR